jgi:teichuronic acid biosynthesis glycosyltransferase TuaH
VAATIAYSSHTVVFGVANERRSLYYVSDDLRAGASLLGRSARRIARIESALASNADVIIAASPQLVALWRSRGHDPLLIPNGVDAEAFSRVDQTPRASEIALSPPVAGFVGHISERIDFGLLEAISERGLSLLLVGPRQRTFGIDERLDALTRRSNVQWVGAVGFDRLPSYLRAIDVGLVPYANSAFNSASFPLKTLEYLAAGRPVVATPLPAIDWLDTDLITTAENPAEYAEAVARLARAPRTTDSIERRRTFAREHSWQERVRSLAEALDLAPTDRTDI